MWRSFLLSTHPSPAFLPHEAQAPSHFINITTMKTSLRFLVLLVALVCGTSAWSAVDPYSVLTVTPAEGNVESLQHFTITFADLPVVVNESSIPTLEKGGGGIIEGTMRADEDGKTVLIDFDEYITTPGDYFLNIPENTLTVNGQRLLPLTLRFIIPMTTESFYEQIAIDPAEGTVESLQNFIISFPEFVGEIEYGMEATLTNTTTGQSWSTDIYDVRYTVLMYFPEEVTEPGEYVLTIPAGAVIFYTLDAQVHELNFHYTIPGAELLLGDVDLDGKVGIADVTLLIDLILDGSSAPAEADVDQNGSVSIGDVTALIDWLLSIN